MQSSMDTCKQTCAYTHWLMAYHTNSEPFMQISHFLQVVQIAGAAGIKKVDLKQFADVCEQEGIESLADFTTAVKDPWVVCSVVYCKVVCNV